MKYIFIWVAYGEVDVYSLDTIKDYKSLLNEIISIVTYWDGFEQLIGKINDIIESQDDENIRAYIISINSLLNSIDVGSHESFEYGTEFSKLKKFN